MKDKPMEERKGCVHTQSLSRTHARTHAHPPDTRKESEQVFWMPSLPSLPPELEWVSKGFFYIPLGPLPHAPTSVLNSQLPQGWGQGR